MDNLKKKIKHILPDYTTGEELLNMISHIVGGAFGILTLVLCVVKAALAGNAAGVVGSAIYGASMILVYTTSSIYHGLHRNAGKKVFRVLDHCMIYLLIVGTYTPILLSAIIPKFPVAGWVIFAIEWGCTALAVTLTAVDMKKFNAFSMTCYVVMGWCIIAVPKIAIAAMTPTGFGFVLAGGIAYTIGAVLYGIGKKMKYIHGVFHIFVLLGSVLQFFGVYLYCI